MRKKCFNTCLIIIVFCSPIFFVASLLPNALNRNFETVVITGNSIDSFIGVALNELHLYAYDDDARSWRLVPSQIDEKYDNGQYVYTGQTENDILDANDELVFMAKDAGAQNTFSWIDDIDSQNYVRVEIEILDPITQNKAYVYLYRSKSNGLAQSLTDYVKYFQSDTDKIGEDRIESLYYEIGNLSNGLPGSLTIPQSVGGSGEDILDRLKFRAKASAFGFNINLDEGNLKFIQDDDEILFIDGPVRVIRKLNATLEKRINFFITISPDFSGTVTYFEPYSAQIDIEIPAISDASISSGRLSLDFNSAASGMSFTSAKNPNPVTIDGSDDPNLDRTLDETVLPVGNWMAYESSGQSQNTIVNFFPVKLSTGGARELYYKDNSSQDDGDTGDERSYGDAGIAISGGISTPDTLKYKGWFLGNQMINAPLLASNAPYITENISSDIGNQFAVWEKNPFELTTTAQDFDSVPVELISFQANVEGNTILLSWQTATESNNFGFEIELNRSAGLWEKVGFVEGSGTTVEPKTYHFVLEDLQPGNYEVRLKQIDTDGAFEYSNVVSAFIGVPADFVLQQNYPNPFNPTTTISFQIPEINAQAVNTTLKVYDLLGKEIVTLVHEYKSPGNYSVTWNATDKHGLNVPSGIYLYRLQAGNYTDMKKMILVK